MRTVFVFEQVAVIVGPWWEPMDPPERGARVEVRLMVDEGWRGTPSAAQRIVVDDPVWRADLFDQANAPAGNLRSAHFHSRFNGVEPAPREWPEPLSRDPRAWLRHELGDLVALWRRSGVVVDDEALGRDADAVRAALDDIVAVVDRTWAAVRGGLQPPPGPQPRLVPSPPPAGG